MSKKQLILSYIYSVLLTEFTLVMLFTLAMCYDKNIWHMFGIVQIAVPFVALFLWIIYLSINSACEMAEKERKEKEETAKKIKILEDFKKHIEEEIKKKEENK